MITCAHMSYIVHTRNVMCKCYYYLFFYTVDSHRRRQHAYNIIYAKHRMARDWDNCRFVTGLISRGVPQPQPHATDRKHNNINVIFVTVF